ncbi:MULTISPECIES: hypothetical protein [Paenisporosarcina]|uniref:Uncharacterized protein n=1 Tax=Paenisporosarcina quisquiliarum TaxID=365346 RepID=A0A9X3LH91_9BACL|nr:hypothetical protein [Paenisporosarcina quisquiliarum]MCZ8537950.1 hypothetical protein [Paenisporosarcina quisquiliarum]
MQIILVTIVIMFLMLLLKQILPQFSPLILSFFFFILLSNILFQTLFPIVRHVLEQAPKEALPIARVLLISVFLTFLGEALIEWCRNLNLNTFVPIISVSCHVLILTYWLPLIQQMFNTLTRLLIE